VAQGFSSPLFILGIGTAEPAANEVGFRTPIPAFNAGTTQAAISYGFRTPLPFWNAGATEFVPPGPVAPTRRKSNRFQQKVKDNRELLLREDEEILSVIVSYMLH